jgi:hypothetical protein
VVGVYYQRWDVLKKILGCLLHCKEWEPQPPTLLSIVDSHKKQNISPAQK